MPRKKETAKERRERLNKERILKISEKIKEKTKIIEYHEPRPTPKQIETIMNISNNDTKSKFRNDEHILTNSKNFFQLEIEKINNPLIYDIPDFLLNPEKEKERKQYMEKIKLLIKYRFSLVVIADMLQCNDYSNIDEIIESKRSNYELVKRYTEENEELETIKLFSDLKKSVGTDNSRIYSEQEKRMERLIDYIYQGKYFESSEESVEIKLQDAISEIIDNSNFNEACKIETEFMKYELDRVISIFLQINSRNEIQELIDELKKISDTVEKRTYAYNIMEQLISGASKKTIIEKDDEGIK